MNIKRNFPLALFLVMISYQPVMANEPPGAQSALAVVSILPLMIILTLLGGGYAAVRGRIEELERVGKKPFLPKSPIVKIVGAVVLILLSMGLAALAMFIGLVFGMIAIVRGIKMVWWGVLSLRGRTKPEYLKRINPKRLIPAGLILIPSSLFLLGMPLAFFGHSSYYFTRGWHVNTDARVENLVAYQLAIGRLKPLGAEERAVLRTRFASVKTRAYRVKLDLGKNGEDFKLYVTPALFPFFPYNYLTSLPSYFADATGRIRRIFVHRREPCPEDGPVVMEVGEETVRKRLEELRAELTAGGR